MRKILLSAMITKQCEFGMVIFKITSTFFLNNVKLKVLAYQNHNIKNQQ